MTSQRKSLIPLEFWAKTKELSALDAHESWGSVPCLQDREAGASIFCSHPPARDKITNPSKPTNFSKCLPDIQQSVCGGVCACSSFEKEKSASFQPLGNLYVHRKSSGQISLLQVKQTRLRSQLSRSRNSLQSLCSCTSRALAQDSKHFHMEHPNTRSPSSSLSPQDSWAQARPVTGSSWAPKQLCPDLTLREQPWAHQCNAVILSEAVLMFQDWKLPGNQIMEPPWGFPHGHKVQDTEHTWRQSWSMSGVLKP